MKRLFNYVVLASIALAFASCVKDLDAQPINPSTNTTFNQDAIFTKCYACLGLTGISGSSPEYLVITNGFDTVQYARPDTLPLVNE